MNDGLWWWKPKNSPNAWTVVKVISHGRHQFVLHHGTHGRQQLALAKTIGEFGEPCERTAQQAAA